MPKILGDVKLFTVEELTKILQVQENTIRDYIKTGKLKAKKLARRWWIPEDSIKEYFSKFDNV
jgi:excisionase family DNA binding protein